MRLITLKELNEWKKTFNVGDKVKVTGDNKYKEKEGIITKKTSYVYVDLGGVIIGFREGLSVIEPVVKVKKKREVYYNNYKVGDWIKTPHKLTSNSLKIISEVCRVYRTTDKSYWVEIPFLKNIPQGITNGVYAKRNYNNVNGEISYGTCYGDENWTIPYESNENEFEFFKVENALRAPNFDDYEKSLIKEKNKQGYNHTYVSR